MATVDHVEILRRGVKGWNQWRLENPDIKPDLSEAVLSGTNLRGATLAKIDLSRANLSGTYFNSVNLSWANLSKANLRWATLSGATLNGSDFSEADLRGADLTQADLSNATLSKADLSGAKLIGATLIETCCENTILSRCRVFGISAWNINLTGAKQSDLIISKDHEAEITVDNLEIAQFVYMLLHNEKIRDVIDTLTTKSVLILGRFAKERKAILEAIKAELRKRNYLPILFDFERPASRDLTETVVTLAHLSRFVIADLTSPSSLPHELMSFVRDLPSVPVQPIILKEHRAYAMFEHLERYHWVLPTHEYASQAQLIAKLSVKVIEPAERKVAELRPKPF